MCCFADIGQKVVCADQDEVKTQALLNNEIPTYESVLGRIDSRNVDAGRLTLMTDVNAAIKSPDVVFGEVGTPSCDDGEKENLDNHSKVLTNTVFEDEARTLQ